MEKFQKSTDEDIAKEVQGGNTELFGILIERYESKILRYGKRFLFQYEDIEDAVQEIFLKTFVNINSFNASMKFSPWIYRIAHNTFVNVIKRKGREPINFFDPDTVFRATIEDETPLRDALKAEMTDEVERLVQELPPKYREPIILFFYEEKDYKEIADIMRIPISTVGVRIRRAKAKINEKLEHE
jgi:RNA polymerase sigma-70 factor (ECF subfamily)